MECVVQRDSDPPVEDGFWRAYWPEGGLRIEGAYAAGRQVGRWTDYDASGQPRKTADFNEDGLLYVRRLAPDGLTVIAEGPCRRAPDGRWVRHGLWRQVGEDGVTESVEYVEGDPRPTDPRAALAALMTAEDTHATPDARAQAMRGLVGPNLFDEIEALAQEGTRPAPELALTLALTAWHDQMPRASVPLLAAGPEVVPLFEAHVAELLNQPGGVPDPQAAIGALGAFALGLLDERHDPLLRQTLEACDRGALGAQAMTDALLEVLRGQPEVRRAALIQGPDPSALCWLFVEACPTHAMAQIALAATLSLPRRAFDRRPGRRGVMVRAWRSLVDAPEADAVALIIEAMAGEGQRALHRDLLVDALAVAHTIETAPTLVQALLDARAAVRRAARAGLVHLGPEALPALQPLLEGAGGTRRAAAAGVLKALAPAPEALALAERRLAVERRPEVRALLQATLGITERPPGLLALEHLAEQAPPLTRSADQAPEQMVETALGRTALDQAGALTEGASADEAADAALARLIGTTEAWLTHARGEASPWPDRLGPAAVWRRLVALRHHPAAPWLAASVLARLPGDHPTFEATLEALGEGLGQALAPPLAWWLSHERPPTRRRLLSWLSTHHPHLAQGALLEAATDPAPGVRALAERGLVALGVEGLPSIWPLLQGGAGPRGVAAAVLRQVPDARSIAPLEQAIQGAEGSTRRALDHALWACRLAGLSDHAPTPRWVDGALRKAAPSRLPKRWAPLAQQPLRWRGGGQLSSGARRWWVHILVGEAAPDEAVEALARLLTPGPAADLCEAMLSMCPLTDGSHQARRALDLLGAERHQIAAGHQLEALSSKVSYTYAARLVAALVRRPTPGGLRALIHLALHGAGQLRAEGRRGLITATHATSPTDEALDEAAEAAWLAGLASDLPGEADAAHAALIRHLDTAHLTGRRWDVTAWCRLLEAAPEALAGRLWWAETPEGGHLLTIAEAQPVDAQDVPVSLDPVTALSLAHPAMLEGQIPETLTAWRDHLTTRGHTQLEAPVMPARAETLRQQLAAPGGLPIKTRNMAAGLDRLDLKRDRPGPGGWIRAGYRSIGLRWEVAVFHDGLHAQDGQSPGGNTSRLEGVGVRPAGGGPSVPEEAAPPGLLCAIWTDLAALVG